MSKFKTDDKVFDPRYGVGVVTSEEHSREYPIRVEFNNGDGISSVTYMKWGRQFPSHKNPMLLTLPEAREKGYDVPKEPFKWEGKARWKTEDGIVFPIFENICAVRPGMKGTLTFIEDAE